jgi:hypothetical protein
MRADRRGSAPANAASIIDHITIPEARAATLKLVPR